MSLLLLLLFQTWNYFQGIDLKSIKANFSRRAKTLNNLHCIILCTISLSHPTEEYESRFHIFRISLLIFFVRGFLRRSDSRSSTKLRKVQIAWRGLIYRDTFRVHFRNRRSLARHLYGSTSTFDCSTLQAWAGNTPATFLAEFTFCLLFAQPIFLPAGVPRSVSLFLVSMACLSVIISRKTHVAMIEYNINE